MEVFEAILIQDEDNNSVDDCSEEIHEEKKKLKENKNTKRVLNELKGVLIEKQRDMELREARAEVRMKGESIDTDLVEKKMNSMDEQSEKLDEPEKSSLTSLEIAKREYEEMSDTDTDSSCSIETGNHDKQNQVGHQLLNSFPLFKKPMKSTGKFKSKSLHNRVISQNQSDDEGENVRKDREGRLIILNKQPLGFDSRCVLSVI